MRVRDADIEVLRGVRMLGALPVATIEQLGAGLEHAAFAPGAAVFRQGEPGEGFYIVESGRAEVVVDGRLVRTLGRGDCFGEIAQLLFRGRPDGRGARAVLQQRDLAEAVTALERAHEATVDDDLRPRTATVGAAADEELRVSVLRRGPFLTAVTGYPAAASAGEALAASRLGEDAERLQPAG